MGNLSLSTFALVALVLMLVSLPVQAMLDEERYSASFHRKMRKDPEVTSLPTGVQYKYLKKTEGARVTPNDQRNAYLTVSWTEYTLDGIDLAENEERKGSIEFLCKYSRNDGKDRVLKDLADLIFKMAIGDRLEIYVPNRELYGSEGKGEVKPYMTVIYEIEILNIVQTSSAFGFLQEW